MMSRPSRRAAAFTALGLVLARPLPARAQNYPSLSQDFTSIMQWFSGQMVQPLAFNAGDTFPNPLVTKPGRGQIETTIGGGLLPVDNSHFPVLGTPQLNDMGIKNDFPSSTPFGDITSTLRYGLPWDSDLAIRVSNITFPRSRISSGMEAKAQSNTFGLQLRKFLHCDEGYAFSITGYYQYHTGVIHFYNQFDNIQLPDQNNPELTLSSNNTGSLIWHLQAAGVNLIMSRTFGAWTPYVGAGFNQAYGSLKGELEAQFNTSLTSEALGQASSRPSQSSMRGLFGFNLARSENWNYFMAGEMLANNAGIGKAINVHVGVMCPIRFGEARRDEAKKPLMIDEKKAEKKLAQQQDNFFFIR